MTVHRALGFVFLAILSGIALAADPAPAQDLGLIERTGRRLLQLDVTVRGPADRIDRLTAPDFEVSIDGRLQEHVLVDRFCAEPDPTPQRRVAPIGGEAPVPSAPASYLFYFDQPHLTVMGRARALELARGLVDELVGESARAMIVANGREVRTFAELTSDRAALHAALDALERDTAQHDLFATQEDQRVRDVYRQIEDAMDVANVDIASAKAESKAGNRNRYYQAPIAQPGGTDQSFPSASADFREALGAAVTGGSPDLDSISARARRVAMGHVRSVARVHQRDERSHTDSALARFSMVLGALVEVEPPKAVIYFGDTLRSNPGDHYAALLQVVDGGASRQGSSILDMSMTTTGDTPEFGKLIEEAASVGARMYTVLAAGPATSAAPSLSMDNLEFFNADPLAATRRFDRARDSLAGLALETGGQAFLDGRDADSIAARIRADYACFYLLSIDPAGLAEDRSLPVSVHVKQSGVETRTQARIVVRSEGARATARLSAAFTSPQASSGAHAIHGVLIPTGFAKGQYTALAQVILPGSSGLTATWDVGLSIVLGGEVKQEAAGRLSVSQPGVPLVFEAEVKLPPGPHELVVVAHESASDQIVSARLAGDWIDPWEGKAGVGPVVLLQPARGVFLRDGKHRFQGFIGRAAGEWMRADLPAALVGIVCGKGDSGERVQIDRRLLGESEATFAPMALGTGDKECVTISDVIPAGSMTAGMFDYAVYVRREDEQLATGGVRFAAVSTEELALAAGRPRP